jgi:hypothetical protein
VQKVAQHKSADRLTGRKACHSPCLPRIIRENAKEGGMEGQIIAAWVYDPTKNIFGDKGGRAARWRITCQNPQACDVFTKQGSCLLTSALVACKFGRKTKIEGPAKRAGGFRKWMADQEAENAKHIGKLETLKAWNRIAYINGYYYLPYSFMTDEFFIQRERPAESKWIAEADMTADLLARICAYEPVGLGGRIPSYQRETVPKFIADLRMFFPALFEMLPDEQKARAAAISPVGRTADLLTCEPGEYTYGNSRWMWDGKTLCGAEMLFQPVKGKCEIFITPQKGEGVKITDASQVGPQTVFLD